MIYIQIYHSDEGEKQWERGNSESSNRKRLNTWKGALNKLKADFTSETMEARKQWSNIYKGLKEQNTVNQVSYLVKLSFKNKDKVKLSPYK